MTLPALQAVPQWPAWTVEAWTGVFTVALLLGTLLFEAWRHFPGALAPLF
jgi:hypothetical protein